MPVKLRKYKGFFDFRSCVRRGAVSSSFHGKGASPRTKSATLEVDHLPTATLIIRNTIMAAMKKKKKAKKAAKK